MDKSLQNTVRKSRGKPKRFSKNHTTHATPPLNRCQDSKNQETPDPVRTPASVSARAPARVKRTSLDNNTNSENPVLVKNDTFVDVSSARKKRSSSSVVENGFDYTPEKKAKEQVMTTQTSGDHYSDTYSHSRRQKAQKTRMKKETNKSVSTNLLRPMINEGDKLYDVLRYWSYICENPTFLGEYYKQWQGQDKIVIEAGDVHIYSNYIKFVEIQQKMDEAEMLLLSQSEGQDLRDRTGINYADFNPDCVDNDGDYDDDSDKDDDHELSQKRKSTEKQKEEAAKIGKALKVTQSTFWELSNRLVTGVHKQASRVELRSIHFIQENLRTLSQRVLKATMTMHPSLSQVKEAYSDRQYHMLQLVISPNGVASDTSRDNYLLSFYNYTDPIFLAEQEKWCNGALKGPKGSIKVAPKPMVHHVKVSDMGSVHPMFRHECWAHLVFMTAVLASYKSIYVNFQFRVGLNYQYLYVFEQNFELVKHEEIGNVTNVHYSKCVVHFKNCVEEEDYRSGRMPQWNYEFEIPDDYPTSKLKELMPTYRGMKVKMMFREDHTSWFF